MSIVRESYQSEMNPKRSLGQLHALAYRGNNAPATSSLDSTKNADMSGTEGRKSADSVRALRFESALASKAQLFFKVSMNVSTHKNADSISSRWQTI